MKPLLSLLAVAGRLAVSTTSRSFPVTVTVDASRDLGALPPIWRFFGADEPNYATAPDGEKLLAELGNLRPGEVYFRAHNLMTTGDGTPELKWGSTDIYTESSGKAIYNFTRRSHHRHLSGAPHPSVSRDRLHAGGDDFRAPGVPYHRPWKEGVD